MINISKANSKIYPQLIELWEASVRASHDFLEEEDIVYYKKRILEEYFDLVDLYIAIRVDQQLMGFLGISENKIEMLFINPVYRKKGVGRLLVDYAINQHKIKQVDVNEQNGEAVGFYLNLGFQVIGRKPYDGEGRPFPILEMQLI